MTKGRKIAIGVVVVVGAPFFIAGAIAGAKGSTGSHNVSAPPKASAAPVRHSPTPAPKPTIQIDQPGDPGTPCSMTYRPTADGGTLTLFTITKAGELITHVDGPDGLNRHDQNVNAGTITFTYQVPLQQVADAGAILQIGDKRWVCSIAASR